MSPELFKKLSDKTATGVGLEILEAEQLLNEIERLRANEKAAEGEIEALKSKLRDMQSLLDDVAMLCKAQGIPFQVFNCKDAGGPKP